MVYADDVNILGGSVHIIKETSGALIVAIKEIGLEVKLSTWSYLEIRMQDEVRICELIIDLAQVSAASCGSRYYACDFVSGNCEF